MTMSRDRVTFFLPTRYFTGRASRGSNGMSRSTCIKVLSKAFGPPAQHCTVGGWTEVFDLHQNGFNIVCRPSQFARFIVYRHDADECINGIKDLAPVLALPVVPETLYDNLAKQFAKEGVLHNVTKRLLCQANIENVALENTPDAWFDVSRNPHKEHC